MFVPPQHDRFLVSAALAAGCVATGLGYALFGPRTWVGRAVNVAFGAAVASLGMWLLLPDNLVMTALGGGALSILAGAGAGRMKRWTAALLRPLLRPRVGGAAVAGVALAWGGYEGLRYDREVNSEADTSLSDLAEWSTPKTTLAGLRAKTDGGAEVLLYEPVDPWSPAEAAEHDRNSTTVREFSDKWIRRGPPSDNSNCHGWVFTGGRYNVGGQYVPTILKDNDYEAVSAPEAGDLCIYRDDNDIVSHSAVVRAVLADGTVLVEGKWGRLGVYLHGVGDSCYGDHYTYFRSYRGGHLLQGVELTPGDH